MRRTVVKLSKAAGSLLPCRPLRILARPKSMPGAGCSQQGSSSSLPIVPKNIFRSGTGLLIAATAAAAIGYNMATTESRGGWWVPTSHGHLEEAERKVLDVLQSDVEMSFVELDNGHRVRTMVVNRAKHPDKTPIVLVHGFAAALGTWAKNIDDLAEKRTVYAMDQVGFGRSDRPEFSKDALEAEDEFVANLEQWREKMNLESFILLGHSLGGFISLAYSFKHPQYVKHLILADPWGFAVRPAEGTAFERERPIRYKIVSFLSDKINPLGMLRAVGPWGPGMVQRVRPDIHRVFSDMFPESTMMDYIYHCNVQEPSGEIAMKSLMGSIGFASNPMLSRIGDLPDQLSVSFIYGKRSWNSNGSGDVARELLGEDRVDVALMDDANHHVYGFYGFNQLVNDFCRRAD